MALAKRNSRTINIDGGAYRWAVSPDSGCMWLVVEHAEAAGQRVVADFRYHDVAAADGGSRVQARTVSPGVVRSVVLHALANGWRPRQRGLPPMRINGEAVRPLGVAKRGGNA